MVFNENFNEEDDSSLLYSAETAPVILPYNCKLYQLLHKTDTPQSILRGHYKYSFYTISQAVRGYIAHKNLYDFSNSCIVMCDSELEEALNLKSFLLSDLDSILRRMLPVDNSLKKFMIVDLTTPDKEQQQTGKPYDFSGNFWVKPHLRDLLNSTRPNEEPKLVFTYSEICSRFSQYLLENQVQLFDERNTLICHCPPKLQKALRVKALHRRQVHDILQKQIKPLKTYYIKSRKRVPHRHKRVPNQI